MGMKILNTALEKFRLDIQYKITLKYPFYILMHVYLQKHICAKQYE